MRLATRAARDHSAQSRILAAAEILADRFDLDLELPNRIQVQRGDPATRAMLEREAIADLLEAILEASEVIEEPDLDPEDDEPPAEEEEPKGEMPSGEGGAPKAKPADAQLPATELLDLKPEVVEALVAAGYTSPETLRSASIKELMQVPGVGKRTAEKILEALGPHPQPEG